VKDHEYKGEQQRSRAIAKALIRRGEDEREERRDTPEFTPDAAANALVADIRRYPHAYVIACIMDRQMKAERAWEIPYRIRERVGSFEFRQLRGLSTADLVRAMRKPTTLHRYPAIMGANMHAAIALIDEKYRGDASRIWSERPSSATVVLRFLEFPGVGPKIATMAANLLVRYFKVPLSDYYSIDISVDVHVRRVLTRLGLVEAGATLEQVVYAALAISPEFPGLIDSPAFRLGREVCRPRKPKCGECYLRRWCPSAEV
jgi:uncharacterized HhH-GPD family protein